MEVVAAGTWLTGPAESSFPVWWDNHEQNVPVQYRQSNIVCELETPSGCSCWKKVNNSLDGMKGLSVVLESDLGLVETVLIN